MMESKLLSMMKSKFESLFILLTVYKVVEAQGMQGLNNRNLQPQ